MVAGVRMLMSGEWKLSENSPMLPPATVLLRTVQLMRVKRARCVISDYFSEQWMEVCVRGRTANGVQPALAPELLFRAKFHCRRNERALFADSKRFDGEGKPKLSLHKDIEAVPHSGY